MYNKEPWLSVNLSKILPGVGQIYSGKKFRGYIILFLSLDLYVLGFYSIFSSEGNMVVGLGSLSSAFLFGAWNLFDAYNCAKNNNDYDFEIKRKRNKDPWLAMFMSQTFFGIGHFYIGKWLIGIFTIIFIIGLSIFLPFINPFIVSFAAYLAYYFSHNKREKTDKLASKIAILIMLSHLLTISSVNFTKAFLVETRHIATGGMEPTLHGAKVWEADKVLVDKFNYRFRQPKRGDIILFNPTDELKTQGFNVVGIQRIVALPGEKVELIQGKVYINNQLLDESKYLNPQQYTTNVCNSGGYPYARRATSYSS